MRIVFFGTSAFAVACLEGLLDAGRHIAGVVTQPDRRGGRGGGKVLVPPVKRCAVSRKIDLLQPENLDDSAVSAWLESRRPDILVVSAYGKLIPGSLINTAVHGAINPHPSLLPRFRGAAPIHWALIRGDEVTGVTVYFLDAQFDTGDIYLQERVPVTPGETAGSLELKLRPVAVDLLNRTLDDLFSGKCTAVPQHSLENPAEAAPAPEIMPRHRKLCWQWPSERLLRRIRGLSPSPAAFTTFRNKRLIIFDGSVPGPPSASVKTDFGPGELAKIGGKWFIGTGDGLFLPGDVQAAGKSRMPWRNFVNGARIRSDERLE